MSPSPSPQRMYRLRFGERERQAKDAIWKVLVRNYFQRWISSQDAVLDLGCGFGEFLNHLQCARRIGVDLNPDAPEFLEEGVEFHQGAVSSLDFLNDQSVDVVFSSNVLEHLAGKTEVDKALMEAWRVLKPGGQLIVMGPNLRLLAGEYWDFWDHLVPITDRSLCEALRNAGFDVVDCLPRFLPYTTVSSLPKSPFLVRLYLKLPLAWRFFGRQFLIRARRHEGERTFSAAQS